MEAVLLTLLFWINQHTHFEYDAQMGLPKIEVADQMTLASLIIGDETTINRDRHTASFQNFVNQLEAVYDHRRNRILISSKIDLETPYARSVILHELVHFIQHRQGLYEQVNCLNALEKDAYDIQALYMDAHHIPKNFDALTVAIRSICLDTPE